MSAWLAKGSLSAGEGGEAATELLGLDGNKCATRNRQFYWNEQSCRTIQS
jgi:hypothetical protein